MPALRVDRCWRGHDLTLPRSRLRGGKGSCRECHNERLRTPHANAPSKLVIKKYEADPNDPDVQRFREYAERRGILIGEYGNRVIEHESEAAD